MFHYLTRLVSDRELAEDLAQECRLRVWRARHFYRPESAFRTWLFTVAHRPILDHAKSSRLPAGPLTDRWNTGRMRNPPRRCAPTLPKREGWVRGWLEGFTG